MSGAVDVITPTPLRLRNGLRNWVEDRALMRLGVLDRASFKSGRKAAVNPVEVRTSSLVEDGVKVDPLLLVDDPSMFTDPVMVDGVLRDRAFGMKRRILRELRRQHNLRTTQGRDNVQRGQMFGDITANASSYTGVAGNATATSATSLTNSGAAFPTSGGLNGSLQGHIVWALPNNSGTGSRVFGVIVSNTGTVLTVDQWYDPTSSSGAAGTTPNATCNYVVSPTMGQTLWVGLSTSTAAAAAGDVLRSSDGQFGDGTTSGASTEQAGSGLARAYIQPTFPSTSNIQIQHTWTYTGSSSVTIGKVVLCNTLAAAGSLLLLETLLNATGTVSSNGDTLQVTWTVTL